MPTRLLGPERTKGRPAHGRLSRGAVAPEWRWFWGDDRPDGLWALSGVDGATVFDLSGTNRDGTLSSAGGEGFGPGVFGHALRVRDTNTRVDVPNALAGQGTGSFFACFSAAANPSGNELLFGVFDTDNFGWGLLADNEDFGTGNTNTIAARSNRDDSNNQLAAASGSIQPGNLQAALYTADFGAPRFRLFVDGLLVDSAFANTDTPIDSSGGQDAHIGTDFDGFATDPFSGDIYLAAYWLYELPEARAKQLTSDPFGPFRRQRVVWAGSEEGVAPPPSDGLSIPIAMHHLRQQG